MARIFIPGGAGFIGSHLVRKLLDSGNEVLVLDSFNQYIFPIEKTYYENMSYRFNVLLQGAQITKGNTLFKDSLRREIVRFEPDFIVQFAALPLANIAVKDSEEAFHSILSGFINLLEILRDVGFVKRVIYISSSMVYGNFEKVPIPEDAAKHPTEIYGSFKLAGEIVLKGYAQRYGIRYTIIRPSAVYGPTDNNRRVIQIFLESAMKGKTIEVINGDTTFLDFTYVSDTTAGIKSAIFSNSAENDEFNITRGQGRSLNEAVEIIKNIVAETTVRYTKKETFHPKRGALDISKAREILGFEPVYSLEEGISEYLDFLKKRNLSLIKGER